MKICLSESQQRRDFGEHGNRKPGRHMKVLLLLVAEQDLTNYGHWAKISVSYVRNTALL